jgi:hypothetical protein
MSIDELTRHEPRDGVIADHRCRKNQIDRRSKQRAAHWPQMKCYGFHIRCALIDIAQVQIEISLRRHVRA